MDPRGVFHPTYGPSVFDQAPPDHLSGSKILLPFVLYFFKRLFFYDNLRTLCPYLFHPDRPGDADHILLLQSQYLADQRNSYRRLFRLLLELIQIDIHIIFYVYLRLIAYVSYLSYILRKLSFHIHSPHLVYF